MVDRFQATQLARLLPHAFQRWRAEALSSRIFELHEELACLQAEREQLLCTRQLQREAVGTFFDRQPSRQRRLMTQRLVLLRWRLRVMSQLAAQDRWRGLAEAALSGSNGSGSGSKTREAGDQQEGPEKTFACRMRLRRERPQGSCAWALAQRRLMGVCFDGWRAAVREVAAWRAIQQVR